MKHIGKKLSSSIFRALKLSVLRCSSLCFYQARKNFSIYTSSRLPLLLWPFCSWAKTEEALSKAIGCTSSWWLSSLTFGWVILPLFFVSCLWGSTTWSLKSSTCIYTRSGMNAAIRQITNSLARKFKNKRINLRKSITFPGKRGLRLSKRRIRSARHRATHVANNFNGSTKIFTWQ